MEIRIRRLIKAAIKKIVKVDSARTVSLACNISVKCIHKSSCFAKNGRVKELPLLCEISNKVSVLLKHPYITGNF